MKIKYFLIGKISKIIQGFRIIKLRLLGYKNIHRKVIIESNINLDRVYPKGIFIGENTLVASRVTILCHEHIKREKHNFKNPFVTNTYIGKNCFIGVGAIILPGISIGDEVVIGAGTVVTKDIPPNSIAVGNPSRIVKSGIKMNDQAVLIM